MHRRNRNEVIQIRMLENQTSALEIRLKLTKFSRQTKSKKMKKKVVLKLVINSFQSHLENVNILKYVNMRMLLKIFTEILSF